MKKYSLMLCIAGLSILSASCSLQNECSTAEIRCTFNKDTNRAQLETCADGYWALSRSCETNRCNADETDCEAAACTPGDKKCEEDGFKTCDSNGKWGESDKTCQYGCFDDKTCKECEDSAKLCQGDHYQICVSGKWSGEANAFDCPNGASCLADGYGCQECANGNSKCDENGLTTCVEGKWSEPETCETCTPDGQKCAACKSEDKRCEDGKEQICVSGQFVDSHTCENGCLANKTACAECTGSTPKCISRSSYHTCQDGKWSEETTCPKETPNCANGLCTSSDKCADGNVFCANDTLQTCISGQWNSEPCKLGCAADGKSCANCSENECIDSQIKTCNGGKWGDKLIPCTDSNGNTTSCNGNACGGCLDGQIKCENDKRYTCVNGDWGQSASCASNVSCKGDGSDCGSCKNDTTRCSNKTEETCVNGEWGIQVLCLINCDAEGKKCQPPECDMQHPLKCENNTAYICENGQWGKPIKCLQGCDDNGEKCKLQKPYLSCLDGATKCENKSNKGYYKTCQNDIWSEETECKNPVSCAGNSCGACMNGTFCQESALMENDKLCRECIDGRWQEPGECPTGINRITTKCVSYAGN